MRDARVLINGRPLRESYLAEVSDSLDPAPEEFLWQRRYLVGASRRDSAHYVPSRDNWGPLLVPRDSIFVLGDRRDASLDSRYFGFVSGHRVLARVRRVYFSRDEDGSIPWSRIGQRIQ